MYDYDRQYETFRVPSEDPEYEYHEKSLLSDVNIGRFGFGVDVKLSEYTGYYSYYYSYANRPTNYDYYSDWQELRWKHVDESLGLVNEDAVQTYGYGYYFYYDYYTYTENQNRLYDEYAYSEQEQTLCYSYYRQRPG